MPLINNIRVLLPCSKSDGSECVFFRMETSYTYEDFLALPTVSLKDYLSLRGLSITGKKVELVAKAYSAQELKIPVKIVR